MAKVSLARLARDFAAEALRSNPANVDPSVELNEFCLALKMHGHRMSDWDDDEWEEAFVELGADPGDSALYMEQVASWGVDD